MTDELGTVLRSHLHPKTWIAHLPESTHMDTQAGPLLACKRYIEQQAPEAGRWTRRGPDAWDYDALSKEAANGD